MTPKRFRHPFVLAAALLVLPAAAPAQQAGAGEALPAAADLLARYIEAIGGREALLAHETTRTKGTFSMPAAGLRGEMDIVTGSPNRMVARITIPGLGAILNGFDGEVGWAKDPMMGARILQGEELKTMRDQSHELASLRDSSVVVSMETIERTEIDGRSCYKVRVSWRSGRESFDCYSVETGLMVASIHVQESPMGSVEMTSVMSDYKEFGGIVMPTRIVQRAAGTEQIMVIDSVEYDAVDASAFEPPPEIKALLTSG